jgi:NADPH:quinone reductase-like Zn-dependent oxidoreductase
MTSWLLSKRLVLIQRGERVLVIGAASGIGYLAVQMAKILGASVMATAGSDDKLALIKAAGADDVVNHYTQSISQAVKQWTAGEGVDVIFEHVGEKVWKECLKSLAWGGRLVTCGATSGPNVQMDLRHVFIKQFSLLGSTMGTKDDLVAVQELLSSGKLKPHVSHTFRPEQIKEAHGILESSHHVGKIVIEW